MQRRTKIAIGIAAGLAILAVGLAPFSLMLLPVPMPIAIGDIANQPPGAFVTSGTATMKVFPRPEPAGQWPVEAAVTGSDAVVLVKYQQLGSLGAYHVRVFPSGSEVPVDADTSRSNVLVLRPRTALAPGRYYLEFPRDGLEGGTDYVYFSVRSSSPSSAASASN